MPGTCLVVPKANLPGLKWVLTYRHNETPRVVVEEVRAEPGKEKRSGRSTSSGSCWQGNLVNLRNAAPTQFCR